MQEGSTRNLSVEIIVGSLFTAVFAFLFLEVQIELKVALVILVGAVGVLNFLTLIQFWRTFGWKMTQWQHRISKRPELVEELYRLDRTINRVLYERRSDSPSLALQGVEVMEALASPDKMLKDEFSEKLAMAGVDYHELFWTLEERSRGYKWKTLEFGEILRSISNHLTMVNKIFPTVYRQAGLWPNEKPFPKDARKKWEDFRAEYNTVLHDWKKFIGQVTQAIRYGVTFETETVKEIPQKD